MKINYKFLRIIIFSSYIMIAVFFCLFLAWMGQEEVSRARAFAENEKTYTRTLLDCLRLLGNVEKSALQTAVMPVAEKINGLSRAIVKLKNRLDELSDLHEKRDKQLSLAIPALKEKCLLIYSTAEAMKSDLAEPPNEVSQLIRQDMENMEQALPDMRDVFQSLFNKELDNVGIWQRQSVYFFERLKYFLIVFSVLTITFTLMASSLFSRILKISLKKLSEGTHQVSRGNLDFRFENIQKDEIGRVMHDFNTMSEQLSIQSETIKKTHEELTKKAEELIEAHRHRDRFMANMSHELRTPLNSIIGFAELTSERAESLPPEKIQDYGKRILSAAEHLLELISGLLDLAKVDAGVLAPVFSEFNLEACIKDTVAIMSPIAEKKGLDLKCDVPEKMSVNADMRLIRQIIINLLGNAIKFTEKGRVEIRAGKEDDFYRIDISDTGIGIAPEEQEKIFQDFHRVENNLSSNYDGAGIGLTLSKRLVELHGGSVIVSSVLGEGSTFSVLIPVKKFERKLK